ncbi:unnamed protein product, partial [Cladocopium goreaui]
GCVPWLCESSKNSMELLFMFTGWLFAKDGTKSTSFSCHCNALGFEFDFSRSEQRLLAVANTTLRKEELVRQITAALDTLDKQECLMLRGRLGFADSFLHGRVGKLVLKKLIDHAYGKSSRMDGELKTALLAMRTRLQQAGHKLVSAKRFSQWFIYSDASYEPTDGTGGLSAVLVNAEAQAGSIPGQPLFRLHPTIEINAWAAVFDRLGFSLRVFERFSELMKRWDLNNFSVHLWQCSGYMVLLDLAEGPIAGPGPADYKVSDAETINSKLLLRRNKSPVRVKIGEAERREPVIDLPRPIYGGVRELPQAPRVIFDRAPKESPRLEVAGRFAFHSNGDLFLRPQSPRIVFPTAKAQRGDADRCRTSPPLRNCR